MALTATQQAQALAALVHGPKFANEIRTADDTDLDVTEKALAATVKASGNATTGLNVDIAKYIAEFRTVDASDLSAAIKEQIANGDALSPLFETEIRGIESTELTGLVASTTYNLPANSTWHLTAPLYIPSGVTITTDADDPATIKHNNVSQLALCVQGANILIENVKMDFNMEGAWASFAKCIAFTGADGSGWTPDASIDDVTVSNVTFVNSGPPVVHSGSDAWCVSFGHNNATKMTNLKVINCTQAAGPMQLTANGSGLGGLDGVEIKDNWIDGGFANSIAILILSAGETTIENVTISGNTILNAGGVGIALGADGTEPDSPVSLSNVLIDDNYIEIAEGTLNDFPHSIFVRVLTGTSTNFVISNNEFDASKNTQSPRAITLHGNPAGGTEFSKSANTYTGTQTHLSGSNFTEV